MIARGSLVLYWLPPIIWAGIVLAGTLTPRLPGPDLSGHDKNLHLFAYLILGLLMLRTFRGGLKWSTGRAVGWTLLVGGIFGAGQELAQLLVPGRSATMGDFVANLVGLAIAAITVLMWGAFRARRVS